MTPQFLAQLSRLAEYEARDARNDNRDDDRQYLQQLANLLDAEARAGGWKRPHPGPVGPPPFRMNEPHALFRPAPAFEPGICIQCGRVIRCEH